MTDNDSRVSRRQMISATGVAVATSLAGCNGLPGGDDNGNETQTPSGSGDFAYPNGFSEQNIDIGTALGESSVMASLDSVTTGVDRLVNQGGQKQTSKQDGRFDKANNEFFVKQEAKAGEQTSVQQYYFNDGTIFIRRNLPNQEPQFTKNTLEFNVRQMYNLSQIEQHLKGISVSVDSIEQRNGQKVAVYTADKSAFNENNLFSNLSQSDQYGTIEEASVEIVVDEKGRIHLASFQVTFKQDNSTTDLGTTFTFSNFNSTSVNKPSWVETEEFQDLTTEPQVDVEFSEIEGEGVTISVNSIKNADVVDVVIGGQPVQRLQEPGEVTIPADSYTAQDGQTVGTIEVYAYKQGQQPTKVSEYTPNAPASSDGNTTNESG